MSPCFSYHYRLYSSFSCRFDILLNIILCHHSIMEVFYLLLLLLQAALLMPSMVGLPNATYYRPVESYAYYLRVGALGEPVGEIILIETIINVTIKNLNSHTQSSSQCQFLTITSDKRWTDESRRPPLCPPTLQ